MRVLITGGAGFAGHHLVEHILKNTDWRIVVLDKLTRESCGFERLRDIDCYDDKRVMILTADFTHSIPEGIIQETDDVNYIVHMGAETHVDRSIDNPEPFVLTNVVGTMRMLDYARKLKSLDKFIYFSTDEVFGPADKGVNHKEWDPYNSTNPYSASKAGGEELCLAYANTYKLPIIITHTMNIFGERQFQEKFIPMVMLKVIKNEKVLIHSDSTKVISGSRYWIHARNVADAVMYLLTHKVKLRDKYNIVGEQEVSNLDMAKIIAEILGKELIYEMVDFHSSRPGHDLRYALDGSKMKEIGWKHPKGFKESLEKTVEWMLKHPKWLEV